MTPRPACAERAAHLGLRIERRLRSRARRGDRQRGLALVLVLWVGALLAVMVAAFAFDSRSEATLAANLVSRAQAVAIAEAGVNRAIMGLLERRAESRWSADGQLREVPFAGHLMRVSVMPETGKIDLNAAPEALVLGLFVVVAETTGLVTLEQAERLADAVLDWRDGDSRVRPLGAEDDEYADAGYPYGAADRAFLTTSELNKVMGMTPQIYRELSGSITVHTWTAKVNPTTASRLVLLALPGSTPESVDEFIAARDEILAEARDSGDSKPRLPLDLLSEARRHLSVAKPTVFSVRSEGLLRDGTAARRGAVLRVTGAGRPPYATLAWYEEFETGSEPGVPPGTGDDDSTRVP